MKTPRLQFFLTKMRTRASLVPNLDHETKTKTQQVQKRIQESFFAKKK
jgi:hypothetical protein